MDYARFQVEMFVGDHISDDIFILQPVFAHVLIADMILKLINALPGHVLSKLNDFKIEGPATGCEQEIAALLGRTVLIGGKRLRPLLTYLMGKLFNTDFDQLEVYAKAIEYVHAASLSHDDVIDDATSRRGCPSINILASNKRAVLAGDYLLSRVIVDLCRAGNLRLVSEMSHVIQDLSVGEWLQLDASEKRLYSRKIIEDIASKKTASVMSWCCVAPAVLANLNEQMVEYVRNFGLNLGLAFQLMDDTLDFSGNGQKDHLLDLQNGIVNSVIFEWLELNPILREKFQKGEKISELYDGKEIEKAVLIVQKLAEEKLSTAREILKILSNELNLSEDATAPIQLIIDYLGHRQI